MTAVRTNLVSSCRDLATAGAARKDRWLLRAADALESRNSKAQCSLGLFPQEGELGTAAAARLLFAQN